MCRCHHHKIPASVLKVISEKYARVFKLVYKVACYVNVIRRNYKRVVCNLFKLAAVCIGNAVEQIDKTASNLFICALEVKNNRSFFIEMVRNFFCVFKSFGFCKNNLKLCGCVNVYNLVGVVLRSSRTSLSALRSSCFAVIVLVIVKS